MPAKPTPSAADDGEYHPILDPDIAAGTASAAGQPSTGATASEAPIAPVSPQAPAQAPASKPDDASRDAGAPAPAPVKTEIRYVKKEPSAIGRWFLRNLFSLLVILVVAVFIVSNLATPFTLQTPGMLDLKFIGLDVTGPAWLYLVIMFAAGFVGGAFFLRRHKVREKNKEKK